MAEKDTSTLLIFKNQLGSGRMAQWLVAALFCRRKLECRFKSRRGIFQFFFSFIVFLPFGFLLFILTADLVSFARFLRKRISSYSGLPFEMHWKLPSKARIASDFSTLLRIKQGEKRKRCHSEIDKRRQYFSTKNPINSLNKLAMNNRRLLIAAEFHFVHSVEKDSFKKHDKLTQNSVSFSCPSKQVSRCMLHNKGDFRLIGCLNL